MSRQLRNFLLIFILTLPFQCFSWDWDSLKNSCPTVMVNTRVSYFHPISRPLKRIYSEGWVDYGVEISSELNDNLLIWTGVNGFSKKGKTHELEYSENRDRSTRLQVIPLSLGFKYLTSLTCNTQFYIGIGGCYNFLRLRERSYDFHEHHHKQAFGWVGQLGIYSSFYDWISLNVFADYVEQRFHFSSSSSYSDVRHHNKLNVSGVKVGAGIGVFF
jgi:hypothetical protein